MKVGKLSLFLVRFFVVRNIKKRRKNIPSLDLYTHKLNINYMNDLDEYHTYDIFYAKEPKKKCLFINIHGGAYMFGTNYDNFPYAKVFLDKGYDVITIDYKPNNGKISTYDIASDCAKAITHIYNHLKEYGLENEKIIISGDSAGGHLALLLSMGITNPKNASLMNLDLPHFDISCVIASSPVYDFENLGADVLTKGARKRMLGPRYNDLDLSRSLSPKEYIMDFKLPLFLSSCTHDFLRSQSLKLDLDMRKLSNTYEFCDIKSEDRNVDHVHNVVKPYLEESVLVNSKALEFIDKVLASHKHI